MGKSSKNGLGTGIGSSPQISISQNNYNNKVNMLSDKDKMLKKLDDLGVKYTAKNVIFVVNDKSGQTVWLENGNEDSGFNHILKHSNDFLSKHGVKTEHLKEHIKNIITNGEVLYSNKKLLKNGKIGLEKIYLYKNKYYVLGAIGTNGFIVSMYPLDGGK